MAAASTKHRPGRFTKANASRLGKLGVEARRRKMLAGDDQPGRIPAGSLLGVLQWHAADGTVRRWIVKQGRRSNGICVQARGREVECGWDHFLSSLRRRLSAPKTRVL